MTDAERVKLQDEKLALDVHNAKRLDRLLMMAEGALIVFFESAGRMTEVLKGNLPGKAAPEADDAGGGEGGK